jgi:hypothetical protein
VVPPVPGCGRCYQTRQMTKLADAADGLQRRVTNTRLDRAASICCVEVDQFCLVDATHGAKTEILHTSYFLLILLQQACSHTIHQSGTTQPGNHSHIPTSKKTGIKLKCHILTSIQHVDKTQTLARMCASVGPQIRYISSVHFPLASHS